MSRVDQIDMETPVHGNTSRILHASPMNTLFIAFLLAVGCAGSLCSQPIGPDIRMLDLVPNRLLVADIRIGDAATIDSVHLAVWGSQQTVQAGPPVPALVVEGSGIPQHILTGPDSRPYGLVSVLDATDRFLILWNDRRDDAPGIWGQFLGLDGAELSEPRLIVDGGEMTSEPLSHDTGSVTTLLIPRERDGESVVDMVSIDRMALPVNSIRQIRTGTIDRQQTFRLRRGGLFVRIEGDDPIVVMADGKLYPYSIPEGRFSRPFVFDGPVSIVTTLPGSVLVRYDSLHDAEPQWQIPGIPGVAIGRDSVGWYGVTFSQFRPPAQFIGITATRHYADLQTMSYSHSEVDTVGAVGWQISMTGVSGLSSKGFYQVRGDGIIYSETYYWGTYNPHGPVEEAIASTTVRLYFDSRPIDERGEWRFDPTKVQFWSDLEKSGLMYTFPTDSTDATIRYESQTPLARDQSPSSRPVLFSRGGKLFAGGARGEGALFGMRFDSGPISDPVGFPVVEHPQIRSWGYFSTWNVSGFYHKVVNYDTSRPENYTVVTSRTRYYVWRLDSAGWRIEELLYTYTGGFVSVVPPTSFPHVAYDPNLDEVVWYISYDGDILNYRGSMNPAIRLIFDSRKTGERRIIDDGRHGLPTQDVIPFDSSHILHVRPSNVISRWGPGNRWENGRLVDSVVIGLAGYDDVSYQRLYGDRFLVAAVSQEKSILTLQVRSLDGTLIRYRHSQLPADSSLPFVLQNPVDSGVIVLWRGAEGALAELIGPELQDMYQASGKRIEPARINNWSGAMDDLVGAILGDTLYVAWTDERSGEPQAYMNAWVLPGDRYWERLREPPENWHPSTDTSLTDFGTDNLTPEQRVDRYGFAVYSIYPNPAYRQARLLIGSDVTRGVWLRQYDALGRLLGSALLDVLPGVHEYELPEVYSSSGLYYIELSDGEHRESVPVFVYRK